MSVAGAGKTKSPLIDAKHATKLLGTMQGGYNVGTLIECLDVAELAPTATQVKLESCPFFLSRLSMQGKVDRWYR